MFELKQVLWVVLYLFFFKNVTVYLNLYLILYLLMFICLQYIIKNSFSKNLSFTSIPYLNLYISKFSKIKPLYFLLLLIFTGLPPFFLFFIKFNLLLNLLSKLNFVYLIVIFLIFFLNMLFYIQFFLNKNNNIKIEYKKNFKKQINHNVLTFIVLLAYIQLFSVFFFTDFTFILKLII